MPDAFAIHTIRHDAAMATLLADTPLRRFVLPMLLLLLPLLMLPLLLMFRRFAVADLLPLLIRHYFRHAATP